MFRCDFDVMENLEELGELNTGRGVLLTCACSCCVLLHQLAHTMPVTVKAEKRIKAMLYYCSMILRAYQSICSAEPRPGMGGWQGGSRAQSGALPRREWNGTGRAAGASAGEPPGTKENKAANPGLTPLILATAAPALFPAYSSRIFYYSPCCPSAPPGARHATAGHGLRLELTVCLVAGLL